MSKVNTKLSEKLARHLKKIKADKSEQIKGKEIQWTLKK